MENPNWPTLSPREYNKFERVGINSYSELIDTIKVRGLEPYDDGDYFIRDLSLRMVGRKTWKRVLGMLDQVGFDWKKYLVRHNQYRHKPESEIEIRLSINSKIDELIQLLKQYQDTIKPNQ